MRILYIIYQICIGYPIFIVATLLTSISTFIGCSLGGSKIWGIYPVRFWGWTTVRAMLLPVTVEGRENIDKNQSYVFVANHQGFFDIFLIFGFLKRDIKWLMKWQIGKWPFIGRSAVKGGHIIVDRRSRAAIKKTYDNARRTLQGGTCLCIFPEGSRTYDGTMGSFKRGAFVLADELQLPVVPLTINGSFNVMPRTCKGLIHWHPLHLTIHAPIYPESQGVENQQRLSDESRAAIQSALVCE